MLSFSFLDPKVNNFDITHGCPLRNQNEFLITLFLVNQLCRFTQYGVLNVGMIQNMLHNTNLSTPTM